MKKILLTALILILTISCAPKQDQKIKINLSFDQLNSNIGNNHQITVLVFDDRANKEIIGIKKFCHHKIKITSSENLAELLQKSISANLFARGFNQGMDRVLEIHIEDLSYKAKRKFFIGHSKYYINLRAMVKDNIKVKFIKNFELSFKGQHFIIPSANADAKIINTLLQEIVGNILNDQKLINELKSGL